MGRPAAYTDELAAEVLERIAEGESLLSICKDAHIPVRNTIHKWTLGLGDAPHGFKDNYAVARELQAAVYFDEVVDIADESATSLDDATHAKHRTDTRKWVLARMNRAKYGDRTEVGLPANGEGSSKFTFTWKTSALNEESGDA